MSFTQLNLLQSFSKPLCDSQEKIETQQNLQKIITKKNQGPRSIHKTFRFCQIECWERKSRQWAFPNHAKSKSLAFHRYSSFMTSTIGSSSIRHASAIWNSIQTGRTNGFPRHFTIGPRRPCVCSSFAPSLPSPFRDSDILDKIWHVHVVLFNFCGTLFLGPKRLCFLPTVL